MEGGSGFYKGVRSNTKYETTVKGIGNTRRSGRTSSTVEHVTRFADFTLVRPVISNRISSGFKTFQPEISYF